MVRCFFMGFSGCLFTSVTSPTTSPKQKNRSAFWYNISMVVSGSPKRWDRWHSPSPNWQYILPLIYHLHPLTLPPIIMEVENGVLEDVWLVSKCAILHFHDYGRKGIVLAFVWGLYNPYRLLPEPWIDCPKTWYFPTICATVICLNFLVGFGPEWFLLGPEWFLLKRDFYIYIYIIYIYIHWDMSKPCNKWENNHYFSRGPLWTIMINYEPVFGQDPRYTHPETNSEFTPQEIDAWKKLMLFFFQVLRLQLVSGYIMFLFSLWPLWGGGIIVMWVYPWFYKASFVNGCLPVSARWKCGHPFFEDRELFSPRALSLSLETRYVSCDLKESPDKVFFLWYCWWLKSQTTTWDGAETL